MTNKSSPFSNCEEHLSQGDIFAIDLVAPYADNEVRIFRTEAGLHGSQVFEPSCQEDGRVFDYDGLIQAMEKLPAHQRLIPFQKNNFGLPEMVIVYADLLDHFVLASQTCDVSGIVSGIGSDPKPFAAILPLVTIGGYLSQEKLPIDREPEKLEDIAKWTTIVDYLQEKRQLDFSTIRHDPFSLPERIRESIKEWNPPKNSEELQIKNRIRGLIRELPDNKKLYLYYLPQDKNFSVPESFIDFCRLYTLPIKTIQVLKGKRIATIKSPYREEFARKLSNYLERIATPCQFKPAEI